MPITGYYDEAQQENDRLQRQAQLNQALQALSGFVQKNRESKQNAPLIQAQTMGAQAEALMNQMKAQQAQQFLMKKYGQQGGVQPLMQQPQFGGISGQPSLTMPSQSGGAPKFLSPQQLMAQNQMSGGFQGGQQPQVAPQQDPLASMQAQIEDEYDPIAGDYTPKGKILLEQFRQQIRGKEIEGRQLRVAKEMQKIKGSESQPMPADSAGRYAFANESIKNLPKLKDALVLEDGTFNQELANKLTYPWKYPKDKEVQNAKRWLIGAMTARGLIQSGTVIKDNEWSRLMQQFGIDFLNAPESALSSIDENIQFMSEFKNLIRPSNKSSVSLSDVSDSTDDIDSLFEGL